MSKPIARRSVLKAALVGSAALPLMIKLTESEAAAPSLVDVNDALAKSLGYTVDSSKVDEKANPTHKPAQKCANCLQFLGKTADKQGKCNLFAGKEVIANGWCKVWVQKPGA